MMRTESEVNLTTRVLAILAFTLALIGLSGCDRKKEVTAPPPIVTVAEVVKETVPVYLDYVGTLQAVNTVDIVARVEGFLQERAFVDGADVKKGDLLFVIDPRPFEAQLENAQAQLAKDEAALAYARQQVERYKPLVDKEFIARNAFDQFSTQVKELQAAVEADRAAIKLAELNLSYCRMYAPFDGRIGRRYVDVGNLVGAGQDTKLATLVQLDPIYVYFSPSSRYLPEILKQQEKGKLTVRLILPDESIHPYEGAVDFVNNTVESTTSTISMRAVVHNPDKNLLPGQYVQVRLLLTMKPDAFLVPEQAVSDTQGGAYVFVVNKDNKVESRDIVAGTTYNGMRIIEEGVKPGERVIIEGLQKVKPGITVQPKLVSSKGDSNLPASSPQPKKETPN